MTDIVCQSAEWGSEQFRFRGYTLEASDHHHGETVQYWWQGKQHQCIEAKEADGRYESLKITSSIDCNPYHKEATNNDAAARCLSRPAGRW